MTVVVDASTRHASIHGEPGPDQVEEVLLDGTTCGAGTWSEIVQKALSTGQNWDLVAVLLTSYELTA